MPIRLTAGNLLETDVDALVNAVNTVGVMGKGIALQFKRSFPENFTAYQDACRRGEVQPGTMCVFSTQALTGPRFIINFPTKRHWRAKARLEDIDSGLVALVSVVKRHHLKSLALPPLGCGNGGLNWDIVRARIESAFVTLPEVDVALFTPDGTPQVGMIPVTTTRAI